MVGAQCPSVQGWCNVRFGSVGGGQEKARQVKFGAGRDGQEARPLKGGTIWQGWVGTHLSSLDFSIFFTASGGWKYWKYPGRLVDVADRAGQGRTGQWWDEHSSY